MEVLSRHHQFETLGSVKVQDWTAKVPAKRNRPDVDRDAHQQYLQQSQQYALHESSDASVVQQALATRLQQELRAAKSAHLACAEVLLPAELLSRVAGEMLAAAEEEPCGIRGCSVFIDFEDADAVETSGHSGNSNSNNNRRRRRIASMSIDPSTVATFELYLTLRHDRSGWTSMLPQFLKNITRSSSTIMISHDYSLAKHKLYNTFME